MIFRVESKQINRKSQLYFSQRKKASASGTPLQYFCLKNPMDGGAR